MKMPRHRDDRLPCLRLDRKSVTGALCLVTPNPLTHCHPVNLTTVVCVLSPNTLTTTSSCLSLTTVLGEDPLGLLVLKMKPRVRENKSMCQAHNARGVELGCELCPCSSTLFFKVSSAHGYFICCPFIRESLQLIKGNIVVLYSFPRALQRSSTHLAT